MSVLSAFDPTAEFAAIREGVANVCAAFPGDTGAILTPVAPIPRISWTP